eukprot:1545664-Rhodomonas_salina.8
MRSPVLTHSARYQPTPAHRVWVVSARVDRGRVRCGYAGSSLHPAKSKTERTCSVHQCDSRYWDACYAGAIRLRALYAVPGTEACCLLPGGAGRESAGSDARGVGSVEDQEQ